MKKARHSGQSFASAYPVATTGVATEYEKSPTQWVIINNNSFITPYFLGLENGLIRHLERSLPKRMFFRRRET